MSAATLPKPKIAGSRPPIFPPINTTFDPRPDGDGDPIHKVLADSVNRLLGAVDKTSPDRYEILLKLLFQRKQWVEQELAMERLLSSSPLPPPACSFFSLEYLLEPESEMVAFYTRLLSRLEDGIDTIKRRMRELNPPSPTSDI